MKCFLDHFHCKAGIEWRDANVLVVYSTCGHVVYGHLKDDHFLLFLRVSGSQRRECLFICTLEMLLITDLLSSIDVCICLSR